ncbi:chaperonin GroEL, partial [Reticulomyxa filosa]
MDMKRGIDKAVSKVSEHLKSIAEPVRDKEAIFKVATISANGDRKLGQLIADAFEKVGNDGVVNVQDGKSFEDSLEVVEGMKFDRGFISPLFITNPKKQIVEYDDPLLLFADKKISSGTAILPLLQKVCTFLIHTKKKLSPNGACVYDVYNLGFFYNHPLIIISEDVDGEALSTLLLNRLNVNVRVCAVK